MEIIIDETFQNDMEFGFIYCSSNECMPGLVKVGITIEQTPSERAKQLYTTGVPLPFKVEFAKKVKDPEGKEKTIHELLEQFAVRVNSKREFFRVKPEIVLKFFDLMDGEMWTENLDNEEDDEDEDESSQTKSSKKKGCRDMTKCFTNGQRIRHKIGINKIWIGEYDASRNVIVYDGKCYTPSGFATAHYAIDNPIRTTANGWGECEYEVNGNWVSIYSLPG